MASDPPNEDRRIRIGEWATMYGFELLDDLDEEAERLPLFVIQTTIDRDVHNVCVGLWEDTDVACFDLRRGSGGDRIDSTGATIAYPYGLPGLLILHPRVADDDRMLSSRPLIEDHALASTYEVRSDNAAFAVAILEGALATWLMTGRAKFPPMSFELGSDWLLGTLRSSRWNCSPSSSMACSGSAIASPPTWLPPSGGDGRGSATSARPR
jgi:hypothetical protein